MPGSGLIKINRAPVLTLWATVVAVRLGFEHDEALTLGRAVAGLNAYSKGKRLGLFKPSSDTLKAKRQEPEEGFEVELLHRPVPIGNTPEGISVTWAMKSESSSPVARGPSSSINSDTMRVAPGLSGSKLGAVVRACGIERQHASMV